MFREKALTVLSAHNTYGEPLENHCVRLAKFALALAEKEAVDVDEDLIYAGAYLHDIGLLVADDDSKNYLIRGDAFVTPLMNEWALDDFQKQQMHDMLLYNHSVAAPKPITAAGDTIRRAVQVEHSLGRWSHGLDKRLIKRIFTDYPRRGLNAVLMDFTKTSIQRDGVRELYHLFFPTKNKGRT